MCVCVCVCVLKLMVATHKDVHLLVLQNFNDVSTSLLKHSEGKRSSSCLECEHVV